MKCRLAPTLVLLSCVFPAAASATVVEAREIQITAEGKTLAHPKFGLIELPIRVGVPGKARVCVRYETTVAKDKGKIRVRVELHRKDAMGTTTSPEVPPVEFRGRVKKARDPRDPAIKRQFFKCSKTRCPSEETLPPDADPGPEECVPNADLEFNSPLRPGDSLFFILEYRKFSHLTPEDNAKVVVGVQP